MKRKVGRPIADHRHPDSPSLTPQERRRIKRRIANRESARRVRARRQGTLEEMLHRVRQLRPANACSCGTALACRAHGRIRRVGRATLVSVCACGVQGVAVTGAQVQKPIVELDYRSSKTSEKLPHDNDAEIFCSALTAMVLL